MIDHNDAGPDWRVWPESSEEPVARRAEETNGSILDPIVDDFGSTL
jgi:hypothetical protein